MEDFDYTDQQFVEEPKRSNINVLDIFSVIALITSFCLGGYFLLVFINPYTPLNPLSPPTPISPLSFPTATMTPLQLEPTWTPTPTIQPTPSLTPRPTWTPIYTKTPFSLYEPTNTPAPTATATPVVPFTASVSPIASTIIHPEAECNWMGVGGTAEDLNKSPILGIVVRVGGTLLGKTVDYTTVTGVSPAYGKSGFEFVLGEAPIPSTNTLWIQLLDQAGLPLSEKIHFSTSAECDQNLILVRFTKVR
ncbi:MAG: hypothetical protein GXP40_04865 [Chloroflexi bacterium]|nr:hypothetical protein [Chloroflexota bacterium]